MTTPGEPPGPLVGSSAGSPQRRPSRPPTVTVLLSLLATALPAAALAAGAAALFTSDPYDLDGLLPGFLVLVLVPSLAACAALLRRGWRAWSLTPLGLQLLAMLLVAVAGAGGWWLFGAAAASIPAAGAALDLVASTWRTPGRGAPPPRA